MRSLRRHGHRVSIRKRETIAGYFMILPLMTGVLLFYIAAFFKNLFYSFTNKRVFGQAHFVGIKNYAQMLNSREFLLVLRNTLLYVVICVPMIVILALALAILLNRKIRGIGFFRVAFFLPAVTLPAAIGLVWKWMMNYEFGLINEIAVSLHLPRVAWLADPHIVLISVSIVFIWANTAYQVIIFLAGLQGIPEVYREAARIDGANPRQIFFHITMPLLSPVTFFVIVTTMINVFQIFDFIYLMIPEGSTGAGASRSLVSYFYQQSFILGHKGYGSAVSIVLFLMVLIVTGVQMYFQNKFVVYEE